MSDKPMTPSQEAVERRPRHFGKSTLVTNQFMAAAKAGKKVKFEHPDYICFSRKSWEAQQKLISQELQKAEERKKDIDDVAFCDCGDSLERTGLYPSEATYYCSGCDETYVLKLVKGNHDQNK